ncbi:MAG: hypothetical protein JW384_01826 [Nitrosomonadaceae bacterium]|nr:hypothetical protein [Nitrosomonadaceae bacterium]
MALRAQELRLPTLLPISKVSGSALLSLLLRGSSIWDAADAGYAYRVG